MPFRITVHGIGNPYFRTPNSESGEKADLAIVTARRFSVWLPGTASTEWLRVAYRGALRLGLHPNLYEDDLTILKNFEGGNRRQVETPEGSGESDIGELR